MFSPGYRDVLARAQKSKDTGQKKALELLDNLIQDLSTNGGDGLPFWSQLESRVGLSFCNQMEIVGVCLPDGP